MVNLRATGLGKFFFFFFFFLYGNSSVTRPFKHSTKVLTT